MRHERSKFSAGNSEAHTPLVSVQCADVVAAAGGAGAVLSGVYSWPHVQRRYIVWKLEKYDDADLTKLPDEEQQRIGRWMGDLIGEPYEACDKPTKTCPNGPPKYWLLHASVTPGVGRRMHVVQLERTIEFAGVPFCRIHILDYWGRVVGSIRFQIGGRRASQLRPLSMNRSTASYVSR